VEGEEGEVDRLRGKPEDLVDIVGGGRVARDRADESDVGRMDSVAAEDIDVWSRGEVRRGGHGDAEFLGQFATEGSLERLGGIHEAAWEVEKPLARVASTSCDEE
jgi:hypothetical protein